MTRWLPSIAIALLLSAPGVNAQGSAKDLRTKEQRLYDIQLRQAQLNVDKRELDMETKRSDFVAIQDLYEERIETVERLNKARRDLMLAERLYNEADYELKRTRLEFLRDATHITIRQARKYRTLDGRRQVDITLLNASQLAQAMSLNPDRAEDEIRPLLAVQNMKVSMEDNFGTIIAEPYEQLVPALALGDSIQLTFRLLDDSDDVVVAMTYLDESEEDHYIILRRESRQDLPTINSVQFSQEGDLNTRVNYDLILERLAEDEKTFRLALVNLPREITPSFVDPGTNASLTQVKFSEEVTRQQLELELQIPEKLSRRYVDQTIEFYVFITDTEGFARIGELNRGNQSGTISLEDINTIPGNKERFELIPRGRGALETIIANRYQEIRTGEEVLVRVDLLNTGTLEVERAHLLLTPPLEWTWSSDPDTIDRILPGEKEPVNITLTPPEGIGVSEYDVRIEAAGYEGPERIEAQEKDITIRVEERADVIRNALIIGAVIALVIGVAVGSIKVSRR
ncbi:MAG TPA: NEW3 domain-containing protein [Candidatus Latescibacteria bacterium]|nr:NEW3 domain-containing protein [Candidatus Latescibacterota bacterium]HJP30006.1 NEW3 domain-containing protein [Candidatus Latescibacterota bacterium]